MPHLQTFPPTVWITSHFAAEWYSDAYREATEGTGRHARRREIVFAVCFAESYLHEWARDLLGDFTLFQTFLPATDRSGIRARWKNLLAALLRKGVIASVPGFNDPKWGSFVEVVKWRDGLVHAGASRPATTDLPAAQLPVPTTDQLDKMEAGYCLNVVIDEIERLHAATATPKPAWVVRVP